MSGEYLVYQSIGENYFSLGKKSYLFGFMVLGFAKLVSFAISRYVKHYVAEWNIFKKHLVRFSFLSVVGLILVNAFMLGIVNLYHVNQEATLEKITQLSDDIADAEDNGEDTVEMEAAMRTLQAEYAKKPSLGLRIVMFIAIALLGLLAIIAGAILFVVAELFHDAWRLKKELQAHRDGIESYRANVPNYLKGHAQMLVLQKELIMLYAQKHYLERLISKLYQE